MEEKSVEIKTVVFVQGQVKVVLEVFSQRK